MSILEVKHLSHGFGERTIFEDVSFRLLKGEHIGLVGANGEGKSTFMSIVTGHLQPDEGKVEWSKYVTAGYLDQHTVLEAGMTVRDVLRTAFDELFKTEERINAIYLSMADEGADDGNQSRTKSATDFNHGCQESNLEIESANQTVDEGVFDEVADDFSQSSYDTNDNHIARGVFGLH